MAGGACVVGAGGRGWGWWGQSCVQERWPLKRVVRILLECILVSNIFGTTYFHLRSLLFEVISQMGNMSLSKKKHYFLGNIKKKLAKCSTVPQIVNIFYQLFHSETLKKA